MKYLPLEENWEFKQRTPSVGLESDMEVVDGWLSAVVPGCVHLDLLAHGLIPDPFYGLQEQEVQWVGEQDWLYRCRFTLGEDFLVSGEQVALHFEGLDTFVSVWLNGECILVSDNMFQPQRIEVKDVLRLGENELRLHFASAWHQGKMREEQAGKKYACWNGDSSRLYVRKAQYHYSWDWGPTLITAGVWRGVHLEAYTGRIVEVHCPVEVSEDLEMAILPVQVILEGEVNFVDLVLKVALYGPDGWLLVEDVLPASLVPMVHTFELAHPQLWWPHGYGKQALYRLVVRLCEGERELDGWEQKLGLRRLELVQRPLLDAAGTSFFFKINNTPIFCGGANWIPADSFGPRITSERYRQWLQLAVDGNMSMLRVWGGGYYEEDVFYEVCDELGLLVWQDFMFGCGMYPAPEWMQSSVRAEAIANVQRLRHHPSIVIWVGNNEDYLIANSVKAYDPDIAGDFATSSFPARAIYEEILPAVCAEHDPTRPYWPGSPFGSTDADVNDATIGDQHIWNIWHGLVPYQDYPKFAGRFISEFGMQSFPDEETVRSFTVEEERYPQSRTLDHHNKSVGGSAKVAAYLVENFRVPGDLAGYIYTTQLLQAEAMGAGVRGWRRLWRGEGREYVAGALIWQLNDCWPTTSWALVDYYLRAKPAYYVVKRELASLVVGLARDGEKGIAVWAVNGLKVEQQLELELRVWGLDGELIGEERWDVELAANQAVELLQYPQSGSQNAESSVQPPSSLQPQRVYAANPKLSSGFVPGQFGGKVEGQVVVGARLLVGERVVARAALWPEPLKYLPLDDAGLTVERSEEDILLVAVKRPAKGVFLSSDGEVSWSDNMLDVLPGDVQRVEALGLGEARLDVRFVGVASKGIDLSF